MSIANSGFCVVKNVIDHSCEAFKVLEKLFPIRVETTRLYFFGICLPWIYKITRGCAVWSNRSKIRSFKIVLFLQEFWLYLHEYCIALLKWPCCFWITHVHDHFFNFITIFFVVEFPLFFRIHKEPTSVRGKLRLFIQLKKSITQIKMGRYKIKLCRRVSPKLRVVIQHSF